MILACPKLMTNACINSRTVEVVIRDRVTGEDLAYRVISRARLAFLANEGLVVWGDVRPIVLI